MAGDPSTTVTFDRWLLGASGLIAVLVVGIAVSLYATRRLSEEAQWVAHTHETMDALAEVRGHLREAESTQRTFLITGGQTVPGDYAANLDATREQIRKLKLLTTANPTQQERLRSIENEVSEVANLWNSAMVARQEQGLDAATRIVESPQSRETMSKLEANLRQMDAAERTLLKVRLRNQESAYLLALVVGTLSGAVAIAGVVAFMVLLRRHLSARASEAAAIAEQGERLRTTLASIGDAVITTDIEGHITGMNPVAESLTGWNLTEAAGRPLATVFCIVNEETRQTVENPAAKALADGLVVGLANHTLLIAKDGTEIPIDDSAAPIRCQEGQVMGCVLVFRNISQRRALERENASHLRDARLLASIVESSNDAIVSKTLDGIIQSWNAAAERLFGFKEEEAVGRHISLIIPPDRLAEEDLIISRLRAGERIEHFETERLRNDGSLIPVSLTISPLHDDSGNVVGASKIARDITARRHVREREQQLAEQVAAADAKFRAFFEQGALFAGIMDMRGTLLEANRLSWEGCGFTKKQIIGKPFWDGPWWNPSPDLVARIKAAVAQAATGQMFREEMRYFVGDGSVRWADVTIMPIKDESGRVIFLAPTGTDITESRRAEEALRESEERFRTLADNMSQFAWMADEKGWIFWYNKRWFDYTGTTLEQMQGWGWKQVHHPDHVDRVVARIQHSWDTGERWEDTFPLRGKDGNYRWFLSRAVPIRDDQGKILCWFGTNTDVTERRQLEEDLRKLAADLSQSDRRKDEFLATLAHELRNPLAAIYCASELLQKAPPSEPAFLETVGVVHRQAQHMVRLIDDLMDASRITSGKLALRTQRMELAEAIERAIETSRPLITELQHELIVNLPSEPLFLEADQVRLAQVFANLLNNAAKYSNHGGKIWLTANRTDDEVTVSVKDAGIGIPPDQLPRLFQMFSQIHSADDHSQGGLGIGLALVRGLVEMHGGRIEAHSEGVDQGSEFIVRLPLANAAGKPADLPPAGEAVAHHQRSRILIADDNRDLAQTLATILQSKGHDVKVAFSGMDALALSQSFLPDLVLLDIGMPEMNGYEVAHRIRQQAWGENMFLAAMTGWGQEDDRRRSRDAGFNLHLTKPVGAEHLDQLLAGLDRK